MPLATSSPRVMPPKMLMKIDRTLGSLLMTSRALAITSALAPPPMSRKLAGSPPTWLTTSSVLMARPAPLAMMPTVAVEADVLQALLVGRLLPLVAHLGGLVLVPLGWRKAALSSRRDLGVEGVDPAVGREDQRVDLDQVGVALDVGRGRASSRMSTAPSVGVGVELGGLAPTAGPAPRSRPSTGSTWIRAMASGSSSATASMSTPPWAESMPRCCLADAVEGEAGVVLLGDVGGLLDPEALDGVALDVHAEDVRRRGCAPRRRRRPA